MDDLDTAQGGADVALAPYGIYPPSGRTHIGAFRTALTEVFFVHLSQALGCRMGATKVRGDNAHHIVEATFKSFARCLRRAMDAYTRFDPVVQGVTLATGPRQAVKKRATKETSIEVAVNLDPNPELPASKISTGITMLDTLFRELQAHSKVDLAVNCSGDTWIDEHHTVEDIAITAGKALAEAFGDKAGFVRMGYAEGSCGSAQVRCVMDLSNRPYFCSDLPFGALGDEKIEDVSVEMIQHFFESLVSSALITVHICQQPSSESAGASARDFVVAAVRSLGSALAQCAAVDQRRAGVVSSSKGTLSK